MEQYSHSLAVCQVRNTELLYYRQTYWVLNISFLLQMKQVSTNSNNQYIIIPFVGYLVAWWWKFASETVHIFDVGHAMI